MISFWAVSFFSIRTKQHIACSYPLLYQDCYFYFLTNVKISLWGYILEQKKGLLKPFPFLPFVK